MASRARRVVVILLMAVSLIGCGDDLEPETFEPPLRCSYELEDMWDVVGCSTGLQVAGLYSESVLIDTQEWMRYYRVVRQVQLAEPLTVLGHPSRGFASPHRNVTTSSEVVATAWRSGSLYTGIEEVDRVFGDNVKKFDYVGPAGADGDGGYFGVHFHERAWASLPAMERLLTPVVHLFPYLESLYDIKGTTVEWEGDIAKVHVLGGWGDCFAACMYWHSWDAQVHPSGFVRVTDLGGDPIPEELAAIQRQYVEDAQ